MSTSEYEGPTIGVIQPGEVIWQYGYRQPGGAVMWLRAKPRLLTPNVMRRPLAPVGEWQQIDLNAEWTRD